MHFIIACVCRHELSYSFAPVGHSITVSETTQLCDSCEEFEVTRKVVAQSIKAVAHVRQVNDFALLEKEFHPEESPTVSYTHLTLPTKRIV